MTTLPTHQVIDGHSVPWRTCPICKGTGAAAKGFECCGAFDIGGACCQQMVESLEACPACDGESIIPMRSC